MIGISLFSNIGVAELGLNKNRLKLIYANEIDKKRAKFYKFLHPETKMICGDIKNKNVFNDLSSFDFELDFLISTPPCQGMSTAGKNDKTDPRNHLVKFSVDFIKKKLPKFILHENVPGQEKTKIDVNGNNLFIPQYLEYELSSLYNIEKSKINMSNFGIPQNRIRSIYLFSRKDQTKLWSFPKQKYSKINLINSIGHLPSVDPYVSDLGKTKIENIFPDFYKKLEDAITFSKYHEPTSHPLRQIITMEKTPTGKSAFKNKDKYKPRKKDGDLVKGFNNTYKRMCWQQPAPTITTYNRTISSQENVHPGRKFVKDGKEVYSDARVLTLLELMILMTIPQNISFPGEFTNSFIRSVIGEGIPSKFINILFSEF